MWRWQMALAARVTLVSVVLALAGNPAAGQGQNVRLVSQIGGGSFAVHAVGNYAYIGEGPNLRILDISNPSSPVPLGRVLLPDLVQAVCVSGSLAYVADWGGGLQIIDISNPTSPWRRGYYLTPGLAEGVFFSGGYAYVADRGSLHIIDVSNPAVPRRVGSYGGMNSAMDVRVYGDLAYVADGVAGLRIITISNPTAPTLRGSYPAQALSVSISGTLACVADLALPGLRVIDVSNASSPTLRGSLPLQGSPQVVRANGNLVYFGSSCAPTALQIIDISDPAAPTLRGGCAITHAMDLSVSDNVAYVAGNCEGLRVIDVSDPGAPTLRVTCFSPFPALGVSVWGNVACVGSNGAGLQVLDISNPTSPRLSGSLVCPGLHGEDVALVGSLAYIVCGYGFMIIDVSNPAAPSVRGIGNTLDNAEGVFVAGPLAYLANQFGGLQILDVSNPASPRQYGSCDTPGYARYAYATGGFAYVADGLSGLQIIDVSKPDAPTLRGTCDTPGEAKGVFVSGGRAYVADWYRGLRIVDVSNPSSPTLRSGCDTPGLAYDVVVARGLAYIADSDRGLQIIDVRDPSRPAFRGAYDTPGTARDLCLRDGLVYLADDSGGVWILQYTGEAPRIQTASLCDVNDNATIEGGDQLVLTLDRTVEVTTSVLGATHFFLAVQGDTLGGAGFRVGLNPVNSRQIVLTLGQGARLTPAGAFSMSQRTPGSPSGIDFATSLPLGVICSLDGISAVDGGGLGVNDSGVDMELSLVSGQGSIGRSGGAVSVVNSPNAAYKQHRLTVPANALATTTTFTLRPPQNNLGVIGAVQIQSSNPAVTFATPATVRVEYREGDIDRERGKLEWEMKVHQLVRDAQGFKYLPVPGAQTLNTAARRVSVGIPNLNPCGSLPGTIGVFAGLPIETVDEQRINIAPTGAGVSKGAAPVLKAGSRGAHTLHQIEFPNFVTTSANDPKRRIVTLRTATLAERWSLGGGCSFPTQSGAVFTVAVTNASGQPVQFTSPVVVTVQFKSRPDPAQTDVVRFDGRLAMAANMRLVRDTLAGEAVDFAFLTAPGQAVNSSQGTLTVSNFVGLTGTDGCGTFGAVAMPGFTPARSWQLYR